MFINKNFIFADAGNYLANRFEVGFQFPINSNVVEKELIFDDAYLDGTVIRYNNGLFTQNFLPQYTYSDYKRDLIKKRYSNDDQIAIILNKDDSEEDAINYNKMLE